MKYALRITRDTRTNRVTVHPVVRARETAQPYTLKYPEDFCAESLQLFPTLAEAETAAKYETVAAEFALKPDAELKEILTQSLDRLRRFNLRPQTVCAVSGISIESLRTYTSNRYPPNPRIVAKLAIVADRLTELYFELHQILPAEGGAGRHTRHAGKRYAPYLDDDPLSD